MKSTDVVKSPGMKEAGNGEKVAETTPIGLSNRLLLLLLASTTALLLWFLPVGAPRQLPALLLLWILPTISWSFVLPGGRFERVITSAGLAVLVNVVLALAIHMIPGPISRWMLLAAALGAYLFPLLIPVHFRPARRQSTFESSLPESKQEIVYSLFVLLAFALAVGLRLPNIGYKEFQGDEGIIMERAAAALLGDDLELFLHQKGPVEILIPLVTWGLTESTTEVWARAPFFLAGFLGLAALFLLARFWFGRVSALLTAILFAIGGFGIAFSRIVQYQSFVIFWTILAVLHAALYRQEGRSSALILSGIFVAAGLLAHYDALMAVPVVAWLVVSRLYEQREIPWRAFAVALILSAAILAAFYVPFAASPTFASTGRYLLGNRIGGNLISWSGPEAWRMATMYNSTYYVAGLILLGIASVQLYWRQPSYRAALLYTLTPLLFYTVVVADPRTHIYTIFPGAAMLAAVGAVGLWQRAKANTLRWVSLLLLGLFLAASVVYVYLLFIDTSVERQRTWAENRPRFYPTTWTEPPDYGLFGFPYQGGWRAVAGLVDHLPYASNEEREVSDWYMGQASRTHCEDYETFIVASEVQDEIPFDQEGVDQLHLHHVVTVNGRPTIRIFGRTSAEPTTVEAIRIQLWRTPDEVAPPRREGNHVIDATLGDRARLLGFDLDTTHLRPGGSLTVTLYWQALVSFERNFQTFVHLYDGTLHAQHDGAPECNIYPTTRWEPGQIIRDPHILSLPASLPVGQPIPVLAGMYDLITGERLLNFRTGQDIIRLTDVTVESE